MSSETPSALPADARVEELWPVGRDAHGRYDLAVTADSDRSRRRRLVGHIETGTDSVSG